MAVEICIGVLGIQGDVAEHVQASEAALLEMKQPGRLVIVKTPSQIDEIHGLIIPGGESTTIGRLSKATRLLDKIAEAAKTGMTILGTCAGAIILAKEVYDARVGRTNQPILGLMNMRVVRNAFGSQRESFEADADMPILGQNSFRGIFIRAPAIEKIWPNARPLANYENKIIAAQEGNLIATVFHPELSGSTVFHQFVLRTILESPLAS